MQLLNLIAVLEILNCFLVLTLVQMDDSSVEINVILRKQVFHVIAPWTNLKPLLLKFSISVIVAEVIHVWIQGSSFALVSNIFKQLLFILLPQQGSYFLNFDPVDVWDDLLLHS